MNHSACDYFSAELTTQCAVLSEQVAALMSENQELSTQSKKFQEQALYYKYQFELLQQELFGRKSERHERSSADAQLPLPGLDDASARPTPPVVTERVEYTRKKPSAQGTRGARSSRFPDWLRRQVVVVEPASTTCPCCTEEMVKTQGVEITEKLCCSRDPFYVKEFHRHLYVCKQKGCETVGAKAQVPAVFERSLFDHTAVMFFLVNKYLFGLPCTRQQKMLAQLNIQVSSDSLVRITNDALSLLVLIYNELVASVLSSSIVIADDTRFEAATGKKKKKLPSYKRGALWGLYGEQNEVVYIFSPARTHAACLEIFKDFSGYLVVDGYDGFDKVAACDEGVSLVHCNNHARRHFIKAKISHPQFAAEAADFYQALYEVERKAKGLSPEQRYELRQQKAAPLLAQLREWLKVVSTTVEGKTPLATAVAYTLTRWKSLTRYLDDGRLPFDTMEVERAFRIIAVGRKNFLHAASENGAQMAAIAYSFINTCTIQNIDPFVYLCDVIERISEHPRQHIQQLLPRHWKELFLDEAIEKYRPHEIK